MVVEILRYSIDDTRQSDFKTSYEKAAGPLLESPYCRVYELCQCVEDSTQFIIRIEWASSEDHLEKFRGSQEFRRFFKHIKMYIDDIEEMRHYQQLDSRLAS